MVLITKLHASFEPIRTIGAIIDLLQVEVVVRDDFEGVVLTDDCIRLALSPSANA